MGVWNFTLVLLLFIMVGVQAKGKGNVFLEVGQGSMTSPELTAFEKCADNWRASVGQPCLSDDERAKEGQKFSKLLQDPKTNQSPDQTLGIGRKTTEMTCEPQANCDARNSTCVCVETTCPYKPDPSKDCKSEYTAAFPFFLKIAKEQSAGTVFGPQFESMILSTLFAVVFVHIY